MSSSNTRIVKYSSTYNFPVSLSEYLVCEDGTKEAIFKFYNGVNQILNEFSFTISEYDANNMLIKTSKINVTQIVKPNSLFVPKSKFVMNTNTAFIKYNLLYAKFKNLTYNDGVYLRPNVVLDLKDEKIPEKTKTKGNLTSKERKQYKENDFLVTSLTEKYRPKCRGAFVGFLSILMLIFSFVLIYTYKASTNIINYVGTNYNLTLEVDESSKTCVITKYEGTAKHLTIAEDYYGNTLTTINDEAFMSEEITHVEILGNNNITIKEKAFAFSNLVDIKSSARLYISANAFKKCEHLQIVYLENATDVETGAFEGCRSLEEVNLSKARCASLSFNRCNRIHKLFIGDALTPTFAHLFSEDGSQEPFLHSLGYFSNTINRGFFNPYYHYNNFSYNLNAFIEDGALPNADRYNGGFDEY